jgi:hypothetical protein
VRARDAARFPAVERWLAAFEDWPAYLATKSDAYTIAMALPSQYGFASLADDARDGAAWIEGRAEGSWELRDGPGSPPVVGGADALLGRVPRVLFSRACSGDQLGSRS